MSFCVVANNKIDLCYTCKKQSNYYAAEKMHYVESPRWFKFGWS